MLVGRHFAAENGQARIAVAALHVAEHLVVGAVLLDDVQDVLDGRAGADAGRNNARLARLLGLNQQAIVVRRILVNLLRESFQFRAQIRDARDLDAALLQTLDAPFSFGPFRQRAMRAANIGVRSAALAVADVQLLLPREERQRGRIPAARNESQHFALIALGHAHHRDVVVVGVGDIQQSVGAIQSQRVGSGAFGRMRKERSRKFSR